MDTEMDGGDVLVVLRAVGSASKGEREAWVSVDETVDALVVERSFGGMVRSRGADRWRGLRPFLEELRAAGLVELHVGAMPFLERGQPVPVAEPDQIEITAAGWDYVTNAA